MTIFHRYTAKLLLIGRTCLFSLLIFGAVHNIVAQEELSCVSDTDYIGLGIQELGERNFEAAIERFTCSIDLKVEVENAFYYRGTAYWLLDLKDKGIIDLTQAIKIDPQNASFYFTRGAMYLQLDEFQVAMDDFNKAIAIDPYQPSYYLALAGSYASMDNIEQAKETLDLAVQVNPDNPRAYAQRGFFYHDRGDLEEAEADFARAIEVDPHVIEGYMIEGLDAYASEDYETAVERFTKVLLLAPENLEAYEKRALTYVRLGNISASISDYSSLIEINSSYNPKLYSVLGYLQYQQGDLDDSIANFRLYLELVDEEEIPSDILKLIEEIEAKLAAN